jgi:hypothetical protein
VRGSEVNAKKCVQRLKGVRTPHLTYIMLSSLNDRDLAILLAGSQGARLAPARAGTDALASLRSGNESLVLEYLLQKQAEERRNALLARLQSAPLPAESVFSLLRMRHQQQQQLQALLTLGGTQAFDRHALVLGGSPAPNSLARPQPQPPSQIENLARIFRAQQQQSGSATLGGLLPPQPDSLLSIPELKRKGRIGTFPQKLHQILQELQLQPGGSEIASFLPHGCAFVIHKPHVFVQHVMPSYFRMSRFSSFQRQLNLYDFQRITDGPDKGAYYHELFVQGQPMMSTVMKRSKIKGIKKSSNSAEETSQAEDMMDGKVEDEETISA